MAQARRRVILFSILLAALAGPGLGWMLFDLADRSERSRAQELLRERTRHVAHEVHEEISTALEMLFALRSLFESSEEVTWSEFRRFAAGIRERHPCVQALEWVPRVSLEGRAGHVRRAWEEGLEGYALRERDAEGHLVPAADREAYYPVRYVDPLQGNEAALGFDVASEARRHRALQRAIALDRPVMTEPVQLVQLSHQTPGFLVFLPLYADGPGASASSEARVQGCVLMVMRLREDLLERPPYVDQELEWRLYERPKEGGFLPLLTSLDSPAEAELDSEWSAVEVLEVAGREWRLLGLATTHFQRAHLTAVPGLLGLGTFLLWESFLGGSLLLIPWLQNRARREQTDILRSVLASVSEGVVVAESSGRLVLANQAARGFVHRLRSDTPVSEWPKAVGCYRSDRKTLFPWEELPLVRALRGEPVSETELFVRNEKMTQGAWVSVTGGPVTDAKGRSKGGVIVFRDVTARRKRQAAIERLSSAVEATADAVFITSVSGVIEYVNPAFETMTGYSREEALGQTPRLLKSGKHPVSFYEELWRRLLAGETHRATVVNRRREGRLFHAEQTVAPMREGGGRITHFVSVMKDLTESIQRREHEVEMRLAAEVQRRLYPDAMNGQNRLDLAGSVLSAEATCGDYYDFISMGDGVVGLVVADVTGHGFGPALIMAELRALLRAQAETNSDPAAILRAANATLYLDLEDHRFVTLLFVVVDTHNGTLRYVNAGHPAGYLLDAKGEVRSELSEGGLPLGILPEARFGSATELSIDPGDMILLLTDGVTECESPDEEFLGELPVLAAVREHCDEEVQAILGHVHGLVHAHAAGTAQTDDITLVLARYR